VYLLEISEARITNILYIALILCDRSLEYLHESALTDTIGSDECDPLIRIDDEIDPREDRISLAFIVIDMYIEVIHCNRIVEKKCEK
jgi:hypothetical protein